MRKKAEKVISFLIEHLPLLVTMFFSAYIVSRSQFEAYDTNTLLLWVLSLLGLLATSILVERLSKLRRIENFVEAMHEHLLNQERKPSIDLILSDRKSLPPLESRMQSSREIMISGGSLFRLTSEYIGYFEQKAREGCRMKFLLVKPDGEAAKILARQVVYEVKDQNVYVNQIRISLSSLAHLRQKYRDLVEIRIYDSVPPFSLVVVDASKPYGSILVELYTYAIPIRDRPELNLNATRDPRAFKFFLSQFEQIWSAATPYEEIKLLEAKVDQ